MEETRSLADFVPAEGRFSGLWIHREGDDVTWDGQLPPNATPTQEIAATAADLFRGLSQEGSTIDYAAFGPGSVGIFEERETMITIFEMEDSVGYLNAFVESVSGSRERPARNIEQITDREVPVATFELSRMTDRGGEPYDAAVAAHDRFLVLVMSRQTDNPATLIERSLVLEPAESPLATPEELKEVTTNEGEKLQLRALLSISPGHLISDRLTGANDEESNCLARANEVAQNFGTIRVKLSESVSQLGVVVETPLSEDASAGFQELFSSAYSNTAVVGETFPVVFSVGLKSVQSLRSWLDNWSQYWSCEGFVGVVAKTAREIENVRLIAGRDGALRAQIGLNRPGLRVLADGPNLFFRFSGEDAEDASEFRNLAVPDDGQPSEAGSIIVDGEESYVTAVPGNNRTYYSFTRNETLWLTNYQYGQQAFAAMYRAQEGGAPLALSLAPAQMRRIITVAQRQMELAMQELVGMQDGDRQIDDNRLTTVIGFTNFLVDELKTVQDVEFVADEEGGVLRVVIH